MKFFPIVISAGLMMCPATTAAQAAQPTATDALSLTACDIEFTQPAGPGDGPAASAIANGVFIEFTNRGPASISDATFAISYNGNTTLVKDRGTFSSGVAIRHRFPLLPTALVESPVQCRIVEAHYGPGSLAGQP